MNPMNPILPGSILGILGGGQLGRMTAMAARSMGYRIHALDPDPACAARYVVERCLTATFDDDFAAADLARHCSVVTLEIEKISLASLDAAARYAPIRPNTTVMSIVRDRIRQREWLASNGFSQGDWAPARTLSELTLAADSFGPDAFVKSSRGGYDGRSQAILSTPSEAPAVWASLGSSPCVIERRVPLLAELSVLVARTPSGQLAVHPPAQNFHRDRVLAWSVSPAPLDPAVLSLAQELSADLAVSLGIEGLVVVELFLTPGNKLFVNELAPRTHNSFHSTEVGNSTSQFEQAVRAICDLPLGSTEVLKPAAIANLLGDLWPADDKVPPWHLALREPGVRLHLYGKSSARPGRKMGHLTALGDTPTEALARVQNAYALIARSSCLTT